MTYFRNGIVICFSWTHEIKLFKPLHNPLDGGPAYCYFFSFRGMFQFRRTLTDYTAWWHVVDDVTNIYFPYCQPVNDTINYLLPLTMHSRIFGYMDRTKLPLLLEKWELLRFITTYNMHKEEIRITLVKNYKILLCGYSKNVWSLNIKGDLCNW